MRRAYQNYSKPPEKLVCNICGENKLNAEFYEDTRRSMGITVTCRNCMRDARIRSKYVRRAAEEGIESLYQLKEKSERTLRILNEVISEFTAATDNGKD